MHALYPSWIVKCSSWDSVHLTGIEMTLRELQIPWNWILWAHGLILVYFYVSIIEISVLWPEDLALSSFSVWFK